ncbi:phytanoyl-CoA dioxygenase family protein [Solitalea sp. MAHUQ-68]|uniref:Phytanoyl-CoA dioxygenase family protein n=1 Tax=Solitalea agri TaxID=2953739 RepID=A0A9X2F2J5_9SPHI|nr:phytanoyl-CoA dioxygenase family protein [Solitalea agri]MCO4292940.1 phytanoyl-CoA dioxygenase family protein [Solitalea agri]
MKPLTIDTQQFNKEGYTIVKNVFSADEIQQLRDNVYKSFEIDKAKGLTYKLPQVKDATYINGDVLSKELLFSLVYDERILHIVKTVMGVNDIFYFGDSSYQIGRGLRGFHRDNVDRKFNEGPDWNNENYGIIRLGIYLQDHKYHSGGLKIRPGSHLNESGPAMFVDTEPGDLVIWNMRLLHSGNAVRLRFLKNASVNKATRESLIPSFLRRPEQKERVSFFMAYATPSADFERYKNEYMLKRKDVKEHLKVSVYPEKILQLAKENNLEVVDLKPLIG